MKNKFLKTVLLATLFLGVASSCVNDDDFEIPNLRPVIYSENFNEINFNMTFDYADWTNFAEAGTKLWIEREFNDDEPLSIGKACKNTEILNFDVSKYGILGVSIID